jgi:hypothetical protein
MQRASVRLVYGQAEVLDETNCGLHDKLIIKRWITPDYKGELRSDVYAEA